MKKLLYAIVVLFSTTALMAQTTVTGTVTDSESQQPIPGANVKVVGKSLGTSADFDGKFTLEVSENPPFSIEISIIGYSPTTVEITQNSQDVNVSLTEIATSLDEVVISASRTPERIMESPVTIERMDVRAIKNSSSPTFYDGLENLKGVDVNTNSLTNKSVNTRGFATFANTRFMQLVDGMDNSSPALNFALGNLLGMSELDVKTVEVLPGAASALYGANAFNGILFMESKNPFDSQGFSVYGKTGLTSSTNAGDNQFVDAGFRAAFAFSEKFAAKASFSFLNGTEWHATDYNQYIDNGAGNPDTVLPVQPGQTAFNQLNVYGDEVAIELDYDALAGTPAGTFGKSTVSRTGYNEEDLTDYEAQSIKTDISLNFRPMGDDFEIIWNSKIGKGNTIYQGANRYNIKNFFMQQHKLEIRNNNFFVRAYMTDEDAGDSYDMLFTGVNMNLETAPQWYQTYATTYIGAISGMIPGVPAGNPDVANNLARQNSDAQHTPQPGSAAFNTLFEKITNDPDLVTGSKFQDETKLYHADGNYNFAHLWDWADVQVGGSWRQYSLNSNGTIFTDYDGPIDYNEYGAYMQLQKKFADDRLKFTGSIRYDKSQNFDGNVSPRISFAYSAGEDRNHNLRASFQTGFRNPTTQDQYIGLDAGQAILVGSAPDNLDRYTSKPLELSPLGQLIVSAPTVQLSGRAAYDNSYTLASLYAFAASAGAGAPDPSLLEIADFAYVKPEQVTAFEVGYRGLIGKVTVDMSAYYNTYQDFIGNKTVVSPLYGNVDFSDVIPSPPLPTPTPAALVAISQGDYQPFQVYTNSEADISSYGMGLGLNTKIWNGYNVGLNYTWSKFDFDQSSDPDYEAGFNTPEHRVKFQFGNPNVFQNFGFNVNLRWNDEYLWESTFADAIIDARTVVDLQVNYTVPSIKSTFKVGAANLLGQEYLTAPGNGLIGSQFFASWTINP
ncbi:TonB-dependent receptor [Urechidicola vernalis]|uniref:TonB-dependent receptor n=1 Tax=Urechidicola vernalis TaxID=3075600 RepID=A0ABU2Y869_9FLAO|nr:TonB-dependent receptor [Urechidicola sp. P050]MDT0554232.1 TonB-dependent receptor [Urechidicola sp. P050]